MPSTDNRKNELHLLIRSLGSHEKAYYRKMGKRYADNNQALHLRLFSLMEESPVNDEKLFADKLGLRSPAHYSGLKSYLWNDLLSTIIYLNRNDPMVQIQFATLEVEALLAKNLVYSAGRLLQIAWNTAVKYELYPMQLKLIHLQYKILSYSSYKNYLPESANLLLQQAGMLKKLQYEQQLQMYIHELIALKQFTYLRFTDEQLSRVNRILQALEPPFPCGESILLKLLQQFALCLATHLSYLFEKADTHARLIMQHWEEHAHLISCNPALFLSCADYSFYNAFALRNTALAENYLDRYRLLATAYLDKKEYIKWEIISFNTQLKLYHKKAQYDLVADIIDTRSAYILRKAAEEMPPATALSIMCSVCISYFVLERYQQAEDLLLDVNNTNHEVQREDILYFSAIFHLVILYERKNYLQLSHAISTSYFRLYTKKKLHPFEKDLMLFLKHLSSEFNNDGKRIAINSFLARLDQYKNDPVKDLYFLYFNYYAWLESKIRKMKYTEYMSLQVKNPDALSH
jgi:hypothetical protein